MARAARMLLISLLACAGGACGARTGMLAADAWPRLPEHWDQVPRPAAFAKQGASLTALQDGFRIAAARYGEGIARIRVARGQFDDTPSVAVVKSPGAPPRGSDDEVEAALRETLRNLQFGAGGAWRWFRPIDPGEYILGLGERPDSMHQLGRRAVMWNSDNFSYAPDAERLYQSIPFWISLKRGRARGFFLDSTRRLGFDVGKRRADQLEVVAADGDFDLYLIDGPSPADVVQRFTELTGRPPMPPLWALGYQQCRWSYDSQEWMLRVARGFRDAHIPCDALYADIDMMDGFRSFTVARDRFPDFGGMVGELGSMGFKLITIIDPGLKRDADWPVYQEGREKDYYVKTDGGSEYVGRVWPKASVFPDFTRPDVRAWFGALYKPLVDAGVAGFWNDMNEPSVFDGPDKTMPETNRHAGLGGGPHSKFHNIYGMLMAQATREGVLRLRPNARPFVLTRANYAGGQRFAATWTGDNTAKWSEMKRSIAMTLNLGLCGQPFAGPDIGGFNTNMEGGGEPFFDVGPELHARWLEFGALLPLARSHTIKGSMDREPFAYGEPWTSINRASIERRYRLLPYLYTLAENAHRTGLPIVRPLAWIAPDDPRAVETEDEFLLGDALLIAPVLERNDTKRQVYLPEGRWYRWDPNRPSADAKLYEGKTSIEAAAPYGELPIFAREGSVIPTAPVSQHVGAPAAAPIELDVFEGKGSFELYQDSGDGFEFERGGFTRTRFETDAPGGKARLRIEAPRGAAPGAREWIVRFRSDAHTLSVRVADAGKGAEAAPE